jgi:hypothetical protein
MAWANKFQKCIGFKVRNRIGRPMLLGWAWCGWSQLGEEIEIAGVYQMRRVRKGIWKWDSGKFGREEICFMRPCWKPHEYTEAQIIVNGYFEEAVAAWQGLTSEEKSAYNEIAIKKKRKGYNFFLSQCLKSK